MKTYTNAWRPKLNKRNSAVYKTSEGTERRLVLARVTRYIDGHAFQFGVLDGTSSITELRTGAAMVTNFSHGGTAWPKATMAKNINQALDARLKQLFASAGERLVREKIESYPTAEESAPERACNETGGDT